MKAIRPPRTHRTRRALTTLALLAVAVPAMVMLAFASPAAGSQPPAPESFTISMSNLTFTTADLTVHTGDTVTWVNQDRAPHDVTTTSAPESFASDTLRQGQSFSHTFGTPGTYAYTCTIHPDMVASVTAVDHEPVAAEAPPPPPEVVPPAPEVPVEAAPVPEAPVEAAPAPAAPAVPPAGAPTAPAPAAGTVPAGAAPAPGATQVVGAAQQGRQLDPLLIIAGVALGVATLCLLMISTQPAAAATLAPATVGGAGGARGPADTMTMANPQHRAAIPPRRSRRPVNPMLLRVLAAIGLVVDAYVHFDLAADYDAVGSVITQGALFRLQGAVAALAALSILLIGRSWVYQGVFLIAASALVPVVLYTYVDVGALGPLPNMYEPVWYPDKTISAIGEAVAAGAAGLLALRTLRPVRSRHKS